MITDIRKYINQRLATVDTKLSEWKDGFNFENVPSNQRDKRYHISYYTVATTDSSNTYQDDIETTVRFLFNGARDIQTKVDQAIELVENARLAICDVKQVQIFNEATNNDQYIQRIQPVGFEVEDIDTNDNKFVITLNLNVIMTYKYC